MRSALRVLGVSALTLVFPLRSGAQVPTSNLGLPAVAAIGIHGGIARLERSSDGYEAGLSMNDANPDYVVMGDTRSYNLELIEKAVELVRQGARLIGANPDLTGPVERGLVPSTGALIAPIERATGRKAYFVGKPNPLMMRHALKRLDSRREETVIIGDRMDTDILSGVEAEIDSVLVLSGVSRREDLVAFAYSPTLVLSGVGKVPAGAGKRPENRL
jgi:NagD protein